MKKLKPFRAWVIFDKETGKETNIVSTKNGRDCYREWGYPMVEVLCTPVARKRKARKAKP